MPTMYPLDLTATLPGNYVQNQIHTITTAADRIIILAGGSFYTKDLVVKNAATNQVLVPIVDYRALEFNSEASLESGREVNSVLYISKTGVTSVSISCRFIGGGYQNLNPSILDSLSGQTSGELAGIPWGSVIGQPATWPPAQHHHLPNDWVGYDTMIALLEQIRQAVMHGNEPGLQALVQYMEAQYAQVDLSSDAGNLLTQRDNGLYYGIEAPPNVSNLYVSTSLGNDNNAGTKASPLKTISAALAKVSGDVSSNIYLRAGEVFTMNTKAYMSGTATRRIMPYDDSVYDGAIHAAILADGAAHYPPYAQEVNRPILRFNWRVVAGLNSTQTYTTGGWVCKDTSGVEFNAIDLRMAQYPNTPGVVGGIGASNNTLFLGSGIYRFLGCIMGYEFASAANPIGRYFRPSSLDAPTLSFVGTALTGAGDRDFISISAGSLSINVKDSQSVVAGTTSQNLTPMVGNATVAFTTRPIEGVVWGQDGMPTNISTNLAISKDGHLPSATRVNYGAVRLATPAEVLAPGTVDPTTPIVLTVGDVVNLLNGVREEFQQDINSLNTALVEEIDRNRIQIGDIYITNRSFASGQAVRQDKGYGIWSHYGEGKSLVGEKRPDSSFPRVGFYGQGGTVMGNPTLPLISASAFTETGTLNAANDRSLVTVMNTSPGGGAFGDIPYQYRPPSITSHMWERLPEDTWVIRFGGSDPRLVWNLRHETSSFRYEIKMYNISTLLYQGAALYAGLKLRFTCTSMWSADPGFNFTITAAMLNTPTDALGFWWTQSFMLSQIGADTSVTDPVYATHPPLCGYGKKIWSVEIGNSTTGIYELVGHFSTFLVPYGWNIVGVHDDPSHGVLETYSAGYNHTGVRYTSG